jgi:GNAT superfamily N-acetyltransferase
MKPWIVRKGTAEDVAEVMQLVRELAEYERAPQEVTNTEEAMIRDGFGTEPAFGLFVAELNGRVIGIALHYVRYSTWKGKMLYLEDIVVKEHLRGQGIRAALFEACLKLCMEKSYAGMTWQVLDWNEPALNFYSKYSATLDSEWVNGKMLLSEIRKLNLS